MIAPTSRPLRLALGLVLAGVGVALAIAAPDLARRVAAALRGLGASGAYAMAAVYVVGTVLLVPAPVLHILTGFALGPALGVAVAIPASLAGSCAAFGIGRGIARVPVARLAARWPAAAALEREAAGSTFRLVLLLRLSQVAPFTILNYVLGASRVSFRSFAIASALGSLPSVLVHVWAGSLVAGAGDLLRAGQAGRAGALLLAAIGAAALAIATAGLLRRALRARAAGLAPGP